MRNRRGLWVQWDAEEIRVVGTIGCRRDRVVDCRELLLGPMECRREGDCGYNGMRKMGTVGTIGYGRQRGLWEKAHVVLRGTW